MIRILFVFSKLMISGEETDVRLLARNLDSERYKIDVVACFRKPHMSEQTPLQLNVDMGIPVDRTPYDLSSDETVDYLAKVAPQYDLVVACQGVPDIYPALERLDSPPPLIEFGDQVSDVKTNPKHLTVRFVADSAAARRAAQKVMDCPEHIVLIPPMVDLNEFNRSDRGMVRKIWGLADDQVAIGWVGRLERKRRVEDFIQAAALVHEQAPQTHFMVIGGLDAFQPGYAGKMRDLAQELGIADVVNFLGDRGRVARLLPGLDALVWLSHGEGMPHVIPEAGAAYLPVVATCDEGSEQQITDGENGLLVPDESPEAMAAALRRLVDDSALRETLGRNLHQTVEQAYSAKVIVPRWAALFDEVLAERGQVQAQAGV